MKKNFAMRIAACLLVVTMLSLCMVSYTYAKYTTTSAKAEASAKVAKWGIEMTVTGDELVYDDDKVTEDATLTVLANDLAAPGTYEKLTTFTLTGAPEVKYTITVDAVLDLVGWEVNGSYYCPLLITVDDFPIFGNDYTSAADFKAAVIAAINKSICGEDDGSATYDAGTAVPETANEVLIDWTWAFEGNVDAYDTVLGNNAANGNPATITFSLQVTVTQED